MHFYCKDKANITHHVSHFYFTPAELVVVARV